MRAPGDAARAEHAAWGTPQQRVDCCPQNIKSMETGNWTKGQCGERGRHRDRMVQSPVWAGPWCMIVSKSRKSGVHGYWHGRVNNSLKSERGRRQPRPWWSLQAIEVRMIHGPYSPIDVMEVVERHERCAGDALGKRSAWPFTILANLMAKSRQDAASSRRYFTCPRVSPLVGRAAKATTVAVMTSP